MDRALGTNFYNTAGGGSGWLYENLFWLMGHPEVYVILIPAVAALMEMAPVFTRRPLYHLQLQSLVSQVLQAFQYLFGHTTCICQVGRRYLTHHLC